MNEKELFYKIAENFEVFSCCSEEDVRFLKALHSNKNELRKNIRLIFESHPKIIKSSIKIETFVLLIDFCFKNNFEEIEICALLTIFTELFSLSFRRNTKMDFFNNFKHLVLKHAMDRPPHQIGVFKKTTVEKITDFFIENVYKRYELLTYLLTKKKLLELENKELIEIRMPHVLDLDLAQECLPRSFAILKQYTENRKPKTELEQKIEVILEFEREKLDVYLEGKFEVQDEEFNKKVEEMMKKKK
jgi:hypothetical protein